MIEVVLSLDTSDYESIREAVRLVDNDRVLVVRNPDGTIRDPDGAAEFWGAALASIAREWLTGERKQS